MSVERTCSLTNQIRGISVTRTIPGRGDLWLFGLQLAILSSSTKDHDVLEAVDFKGSPEVRRDRNAYTLFTQPNRPCQNRPRLAIQSSPLYFSRSGSSRPTLVETLSRSVLPYFPLVASLRIHPIQSPLTSRTALASASILTAGSIAWYTHLYGSLPFVGEVHANSPGEDGLHPTAYPWSHNGWFDTFDHTRYPSPLALAPLLFNAFFQYTTGLSGLP